MRYLLPGLLGICVALIKPYAAMAQGSPALWLEGNYGILRHGGLNLALQPELRLQGDRLQYAHALWDGRHYWGVDRLQMDLKGDYRHKWKISGGSVSGMLGGGVRLAWRNLPQWIEVRPRVFADARMAWQWRRWNGAYRLRWQQQFSDFGIGNGAEPLTSYGRHKFALEYKWAKGRSLEWAEEWWVPVPGEVEGVRAWGIGQYDHRRSTLTASFRYRGQGWTLGLGWDRDRFSPDGLGALYILRLGHQWNSSRLTEKNAGG